GFLYCAQPAWRPVGSRFHAGLAAMPVFMSGMTVGRIGWGVKSNERRVQNHAIPRRQGLL
ncbi:hypothetical protein, partial [Bowmanella yangjiangensis]